VVCCGYTPSCCRISYSTVGPSCNTQATSNKQQTSKAANQQHSNTATQQHNKTENKNTQHVETLTRLNAQRQQTHNTGTDWDWDWDFCVAWYGVLWRVVWLVCYLWCFMFMFDGEESVRDLLRGCSDQHDLIATTQQHTLVTTNLLTIQPRTYTISTTHEHTRNTITRSHDHTMITLHNTLHNT
jgi:hypothetical protein